MKKNSDSLTRFPSISYLLTFFVKLMDMTADDVSRLSKKVQNEISSNQELKSFYEYFRNYLNLDDFYQKKMKRFSEESDISFEEINKLQLSFTLLITFAFVKNKNYSPVLMSELESLLSNYKELIKSVQLGDTSFEKLTYIILAYFFIPFTALRMAEYKYNYAELDAGLPGGKFWFLPLNEGRGIEYPIIKVIQWLLHLSGEKNETVFLQKYVSFTEDEKDTNLKNYSNWKKGKPIKYKKLMDLIEKINPDKFNNCLILEEQDSLEFRFSKVISYIYRNGFSPFQLSLEIPWDEDAITSLLTNPADVPVEMKELFIYRMVERFSKPSRTVIENGLLIASVFQNSFHELIKILPENDACSLAKLFVTIYNNYYFSLTKSGFSETSRMNYFEILKIQILPYIKNDKNYDNLFLNLINHLCSFSPKVFSILLNNENYKIDFELNFSSPDIEKNNSKELEKFTNDILQNTENIKSLMKSEDSEAENLFYKEYSQGNYEEAIRITKRIPDSVILNNAQMLSKLIESYRCYVIKTAPPEVEWYHFDNYTKELLSRSKDKDNEDTYKYAAHSRLDFLLCDFRKKLNSERSEIEHLLNKIELFQENRYYGYLLDYKKGQYFLFLRDFQSAENHFKQGLASADRRGGSPQYFILEKLFILARLMGKEDSTLEYSRKLILLGYCRNHNELSVKTEMLKDSDRKIPHIGFFP